MKRGASLLIASLLVGCSDSPTAPLLPPLTDLPADLAAIEFRAQGKPTAPYAMLELRVPGSFNGFVMVNGDGQPVWFFRTIGGPLSASRRANGNFILLDTGRGLLEVKRDGTVLNTIPQENAPGRRIHHDAIVTDRNTVLFIAEDWQPARNTLVMGEAIWEWTPETNTLQKRWSSFDFFDPLLDWGPRSVVTDWLHANALSRGANGSILMSLHFLNQIISIAPDFKSVQWRLGGTRATISVDDPFSGQHTAAQPRSNRILMFDNGIERTIERYSRAIEYEITGTTARKIWQWRPVIDNWAVVISGARRLPNGNTLVGFGTPRDSPAGATGPIEVFEVNNAGQVVWHLAVGDVVRSMYRATPWFEF